MMRVRPDKVFLLSALSGLLLALSFPKPDIASLAWVGLIPLLLVMQQRPFRSGFTAGLFFFAPVLYWLNIVMTTYGRLHPVLSLVAYLMLVAFLSLYFATATWAACRLKAKLGLATSLTLPVLWVGLEFLRSFFLSGFPWASLGYSQQSHLALIQSADLFGVYGLSFLLVLCNVVLAAVMPALWQRDLRQLPRLGLSILTLLFIANLGYGHWRLGQGLDERGETLPVTLVQGNIDQAVKWDPSQQRRTVEIYRDLSLEAAGKGAGLIVWPESATPFYFQEQGELADEVTQVAATSVSFLLFGSPAYERVNQRYRFLNSAFLLGPSGDRLGRSDKIHLVPFGEYVPLGKFLPFIDKLVTGIGDFSPGSVSPLAMNGSSLGVLVCYEAIFPELAREWVRQGSDLLVNVTNDAWFGRSSAPYQHLAMTRFRAVENRVWVARAANTGISAFIAPSGAILASTPIFETLFLKGQVRLGAQATVYTMLGDLLPAICLGISVFWLVRTRRHLAPESD